MSRYLPPFLAVDWDEAQWKSTRHPNANLQILLRSMPGVLSGPVLNIFRRSQTHLVGRKIWSKSSS